MREYDVMIEERTIPMIGFAPMPSVAPKRRLVRKPLKRVALAMPEPKEVDDSEPKSRLYHRLDRAFAQVRLMLDGKMPEKSAEELLEELRTEKLKLEQDELQDSTH